MHLKFPISQGKFALIDESDFAALSDRKWSFSHGYAVRAVRVEGKNIRIYMHRFLMQPAEGLQVDHINMDRLDNRRSNLRVVSKGYNMQNTRARRVYKGICFLKDEKRWIAQIAHNKKHYHLGRYETDLEAALAYNRAALRLFGPHAHLNKVTDALS